MNKIAKELDRLAGSLETLGQRHAATLLDTVTNLIEKRASVGREVEVRMHLAELPKTFVGEIKPTRIVQGFLAKVDDASVRIRKEIGPDGVEKYTQTSKYAPLCEEAEMEISRGMFEALRPSLFRLQEKDRYHVDGWDIDEVLFPEHAVFAEFEVDPERYGTSLRIPAEFAVVGEPNVPAMPSIA